MNDYEKAVQLLKEHGQQTVLKELEKNKNQKLIEQIVKINFEQIEDCKSKIGKEEQFKDEKIEKISYTDGSKLSDKEKEQYEKIGRDIISKGKYAIVTMAGGQRNKTWTFRA